MFVAISGPFVPRLRRSAQTAAFLDGVNVASLALLAIVTAALAGNAVVDWTTAGIALGATTLFLRFRLNSAWLVLGGGMLGFLAQLR